MSRIVSITVLLLLAAALPSRHAIGEVAITPRPQPLDVRADGYAATVDSDGCLTNLRIAGNEFLAPGVSISRGTYFYRGGALKLERLNQQDAQITAESDAAAIEYNFEQQSMRWRLKNLSDEQLIFFFVLTGDLKAVAGPDGAIVSSGVADEWTRIACYRAGARLVIEGCDRVWGPWHGEHQVVQVTLQALEERELRLACGAADEAEAAAIAQLTAPAPEPEVTVHSPKNYQVFQRRSEAEGPVLISGRFKAECDRAEFRTLGQPRQGELDQDWRALPLVGGRRFNLPITLPAGGWYRLEVRSLRGDQPIAEAAVEHFGVGEVFVGAGQSNSTNSGEHKTQQTSGMVSSFSGDHWQIADDPQPGVADRSTGGSFWPAFGDAMHERLGVPIGVATTGFGGTSVNQWQPGAHLFDWTSKRIRQLGPMGFRALLWHQGESDVQMESDEYFSKLQTVIRASRAEAGWEFPWFVAQATYHNAENPAFESVRRAQARTWAEGVALRGPDTDTLTGDHRDFGGKGIHFSPKGLREHGRIWAELAGDFVESAPSAGQ